MYSAAPLLRLPAAPLLVAGHGKATLLTPDGEFHTGAPAAILALLRPLPSPMLVHAPATFRNLHVTVRAAFDLLELFAFVWPARPVPPTPRGLAVALDLDPPRDAEAAAALLPVIAETLLARLWAGRDLPANRDAAGLAARMGQADWPWARYVMAALGKPGAAPSPAALAVWKLLPEWEEGAPPPPPSSHPVEPAAARARLAAMLGTTAAARPGQADYADAAAAAFAPRTDRGAPVLVLANPVGTNAAIWRHQVPVLSRHFRVVRYEHRGHGPAGAQSRPWRRAPRRSSMRWDSADEPPTRRASCRMGNVARLKSRLLSRSHQSCCCSMSRPPECPRVTLVRSAG